MKPSPPSTTTPPPLQYRLTWHSVVVVQEPYSPDPGVQAAPHRMEIARANLRINISLG